MAEPQAAAAGAPAVEASYTSAANEAFAVSLPVPRQASDSVADRTAYLKALREATVSLQGRINKELTARMEEDKAKELARDPAAAKKSVDEAKEEENYGEEVAEED